MSHPAALRRGITVRLVKLFLTMIVAVLNSDCCKGSLSPFPNYIIQQPPLGCHAAPNTTRVSSCGPERRRLWRTLTAVHIYRSVEYSPRNFGATSVLFPCTPPGIWCENSLSTQFNKLSPQDSAHVPEVGVIGGFQTGSLILCAKYLWPVTHRI